MNNSAPAAQANSTTNNSLPRQGLLSSLFSRTKVTTASKSWKPLALRVPVLVLTIAICWSLIAFLQYLLTKSQQNNGILFAPKIKELPIRQTFLYQYFPTILAVLFSIHWAWIDLETKRLEPYYQLSKPGGALGKDSLLLHYPFDFIPLVPIKALKDRHWPVFWASFAVVLVTWGLVPTQAGIFSVRTVTRTTDAQFITSTSSIPIQQQATTLTLRYAQSTYGIATLNETLPPYMAHNFTLAPFEPLKTLHTNGSQQQSNWTAPTTMYFLNLVCDDVSHGADTAGKQSYISRGGCNFTAGLSGNATVAAAPAYNDDPSSNKDFTSFYVGYHNGNLADWSLDEYCPKSENTTFYIAYTKNKLRAQDPPQNVTAVFCKAKYYQQSVSATIDAITRRPLKVDTTGDKEELPWNIFNVSMFETTLNTNAVRQEVRGNIFPSKMLPTYQGPIIRGRSSRKLSLTIDGGAVTQPIVGLAIGTDTRPLDEYLDWTILSKAFADAYRLLFARAMVEVLDNSFGSSVRSVGKTQIRTEAVVLEPVFVFIVEGFLGVVSVAAIALLVLSVIWTRILHTDPSTIASIMAIVADNEPLLSDFSELDCCTMEDMEKIIGQKRYKLADDGSRLCIAEFGGANTSNSQNGSQTTPNPRRNTPVNVNKPVRPFEFSLWIGFPFINLFVILSVTLGVIFSKSQMNGLPLPSANSIVENILENYIPTAIATLIEPMWVLINRLLCMLRPLEELQDCNAKAKNSIDLNYSSLPPQLVVAKALRSKHFVLAAVCTMALLANVLAVAFAGLFNQDMTDIRHNRKLQWTYDKFVTINGSVGPSDVYSPVVSKPSGAWQGGDGQDHFLIAESNYSRGTPLPPWTDEKLFYRPFLSNNTGSSLFTDTGNQAVATTKAFGAELDCTPLELGNNFAAKFYYDAPALVPSSPLYFSFNVTIPDKSGNVRCSLPRSGIRPGPIGQQGACVAGPSAAEIVEMLSPRGNATQREKDVCRGSIVMGWLRNPQGSCPLLGKSLQVNKENSLFVRCTPRFVTGHAEVWVDMNGRLTRTARKVTMDEDEHSLAQFFSEDPLNLVEQSNRFLFYSPHGNGWHNDSFADDFMNYFVSRSSNNRLVDPVQAVPRFDDVVMPLNRAYSRLFAIWLGANKDLLFTKPEASVRDIDGWVVTQEKRLFVSKTMFILSEVILGIYVVVAILVYAHRPGQYLARLPTSIASLVALFAASSAVQDMRGTSYLDGKGRAKHLESFDSRYGYGSFVGGDGRVHIGIEKTPFVRVRSKTTWLERKVPLLRKVTGGG